MTDLLDAVHALTRPVHRKIIQDNPDGPETTRVVTIIDQPLLEQLDAAIRSDIGGTVSGGSDPRTRSLVDAGALMKMMQISSQVGDWARIVGSDIDKASLPVTLERWHVKYLGGVHEQGISDGHTKILTKWAESIVEMLNPPKQMDFAQPCPACSSDCWWDPKTEASYPRPLVVYYRPADSGVVLNATGLCRACKKVFGARELAYALEQMGDEQIA